MPAKHTLGLRCPNCKPISQRLVLLSTDIRCDACGWYGHSSEAGGTLVADNLMAAAPDLLAALEAILAHVESDTTERIGNQCTLCYSYRMMARAAIRKAKGAPQC